MKVGPHVMTHSNQHHHEREVVPRVGSAQAGGNLKLIQCQLMLLLHARRCQQRHDLVLARNSPNQQLVTNSVARALLLNCPIKHCGSMKQVLNHMKQCSVGGACTYQHCTTSLRILSHWSNCSIDDCPLCKCVRDRIRSAKEWESKLPRSSRYTLLAAALRSSQAPRPLPPNCNTAEKAQEGQSGWPNTSNDNLHHQQPGQTLQQKRDTTESCDKQCGDKVDEDKPNIPSLDQVRKAYEQLGIPCPEESLKRLMATLPVSSRSPLTQQRQAESESENENSMDTNESANADQGVFDCSSSEPSPISVDSDSERNQPSSSRHFQFQQNQQHQMISSTTTATTRLPHKSSNHPRPK